MRYPYYTPISSHSVYGVPSYPQLTSCMCPPAYPTITTIPWGRYGIHQEPIQGVVGEPVYITAWEGTIDDRVPVGEPIPFPSYLDAVAPGIRETYLDLFDPNPAIPRGRIGNPIMLDPYYTREELVEFRKYVEVLPKTSRNIDGNPVETNIQNVYGTKFWNPDRINETTILVNTHVQYSIRELLPSDTPEGNRQLLKLLEMSEGSFDIRSLSSALARVIVDRLWSQIKDFVGQGSVLENTELLERLTEALGSAPFYSIAPILYQIELKRIGAEELWVADWIGVRGQPDIESDGWVGLDEQTLTHLNGLNLIKRNEAVTHLNLSHNFITSLAPNTFNRLGNLQVLSLQYNKITYIDSNAFNGLANLKDLNLIYNQIKSIDSNTFNGLTDLQTLSLNHNQIRLIASNTFSGLRNLQKLYLAYNRLPGTKEEFRSTHPMPPNTHLSFTPQNPVQVARWPY